MGLIAAWHIMSLKLAYDRKDESNPAAILFTDQQIILLKILLPTLQGKTLKQMNPYKPLSFAWASWIIARLGGWSGYASQVKAGYITFRDGYRDFRSKFEAYQAIRDVYRE